MTLEDLGVDTLITIQSHTKIDTIEFDAVIDDIDKSNIWLSPVKDKEERLVNFDSDFVYTDILSYQGERLFVFKNVKIHIDGHIDHMTQYCWKGTQGELFNRRETPRFIVNKTCAMRRGHHRGVTSAYLKDISQEGFAVICKGNQKLGDAVNISIMVDERLIYFEGEIVRIVEDDNSESDRKLIGCKLANDSKLLNQWIMQIQRDRLKVQRGY